MGSDGFGANSVDGNLELTPVATALPARSEMHAVKKTKQTPTKPSNAYSVKRCMMMPKAIVVRPKIQSFTLTIR